jgi:hypothetical protein
MMINWLAIRYAAYLGAILLYSFMCYQQGEKATQTLWDKEKAELLAQYNRAVIAAQQQEDKQNEITKRIQTRYNIDTRILTDRLLHVSEECSFTVPAPTESTAGTAPAVEARASFKVSDAISDTNQCTKLIEWVKEQGLDK